MFSEGSSCNYRLDTKFSFREIMFILEGILEVEANPFFLLRICNVTEMCYVTYLYSDSKQLSKLDSVAYPPKLRTLVL